MSAKKGSTNIYNQTLRYYSPAKGTSALYSGNISEWSSQQASLQQETYGFTYDLQGRITQSALYSGTATSAQNSWSDTSIRKASSSPLPRKPSSQLMEFLEPKKVSSLVPNGSPEQPQTCRRTAI